MSEIERIAAENGFTETGYVEIKNIKYHPEVRKICEGNTCHNYGTSWACPPAAGTVEECKKRVEQYDKFLLFSKVYEVKDLSDFSTLLRDLHNFKRAVDMFDLRIKDILPKYQLLSNEGCGRCEKCTYPDGECRFPNLLHHSIEGYGFMIKELADAAGMKYNNGPNTVTFFGALLYTD